VPETPTPPSLALKPQTPLLPRSLRSPEDTVVVLAFRAHAIAGSALTEDAGTIVTYAQHSIAGRVGPIHTALAKHERLADYAVVVPTRADHTVGVAALPAHAIAGGAATQYGVGGGATRHHRNAIGAATSDADTIGAGT